MGSAVLVGCGVSVGIVDGSGEAVSSSESVGSLVLDGINVGDLSIVVFA